MRKQAGKQRWQVLTCSLLVRYSPAEHTHKLLLWRSFQRFLGCEQGIRCGPPESVVLAILEKCAT